VARGCRGQRSRRDFVPLLHSVEAYHSATKNCSARDLLTRFWRLSRWTSYQGSPEEIRGVCGAFSRTLFELFRNIQHLFILLRMSNAERQYFFQLYAVAIDPTLGYPAGRVA
jgi:hypothetical protein